jgi:hypothetical protein
MKGTTPAASWPTTANNVATAAGTCILISTLGSVHVGTSDNYRAVLCDVVMLRLRAEFGAWLWLGRQLR